MKEIEKIALAKVVREADYKAASDTVEPGEYRVCFTVRIDGVVKKGADAEMVVAQAARPWALLAVALSKLNGVTVESIVREAEDGRVEEEEIKVRAEKAMAEIKEGVVRKTRGKVTTKLNVEVVS